MIRALQDNVVVRLLPKPKLTRSGALHIPDTVSTSTKATVFAEVMASGPGYRLRNGRGKFVPNETKPGDVVLIDALAGQDFVLDLNVPRQNKDASWSDERGEFRILREDEIHCVVDDYDGERAA